LDFAHLQLIVRKSRLQRVHPQVDTFVLA